MRDLPDDLETPDLFGSSRLYRDNAVLVTMKVLEAAGLLTLDLPSAST